MGAHLVQTPEGIKFQSDKYPTCPAGKVPLSTKDPKAQPLLWAYAEEHRSVDAEFSDDLQAALRADGYKPPVAVCFHCQSSVTITTKVNVVAAPTCSKCGKLCEGGHWVVQEP